MNATVLGGVLLVSIVGITWAARWRHWSPALYGIAIGLLFAAESVLYGYGGFQGLPIEMQIANLVLPASGAFAIGSVVGGVFAVAIFKLWDNKRQTDSGNHLGIPRKSMNRIYGIALLVAVIVWLPGSYIYGVWLGSKISSAVYPTVAPTDSQPEISSTIVSSLLLGTRNEHDEQTIQQQLDYFKKVADESQKPAVAHIKQVAAYKSKNSGAVVVTTDVTADTPMLGDVLQMSFFLVYQVLDGDTSFQDYSVIAVEYLSGSKK